MGDLSKREAPGYDEGMPGQAARPLETPTQPATSDPSNAATGALLELEDIEIRFFARKGLLGRTPIYAINGVSLSVSRGETVALVGESGSGKTTLGRTSLRLVKPTAGAIRFDGRDITRLDDGKLKSFRRRAQAVFQDPYSSLNAFMTVAQIVEEPLLIHNLGDKAARMERVRRALNSVRMSPPEPYLGKYPHTLSGGQRQRVGLARALVLDPDYIVADEPVSMIDASSRAEILYLMRDLQREFGIAFLYITHDIASAAHFSDRVAVMYLGRIVELGPPPLVINEPMHPYTRGLIAAVPEPDPANRLRQREVVPGEPPSAAELPSGCAFHPRCPKFMSGLCEGETPALREVRPGHFVACYLFEEAAMAQRTGTAAEVAEAPPAAS